MAPRTCQVGMPKRIPTATTLWGDGFAEDELLDLWAVRDWSTCSTDEYVLLFPRLIPRTGEFPPALRTHLENCVAVRAWRLARLDGRTPPAPLRSRLSDPQRRADQHRDWFADDDALDRLRRRLGLPQAAPEGMEDERRMLAFLDLVLSDLQADRKPAWDDVSEILLPFGAGIHPGYLWPEATVSQARGIAAGWLGHLDRGRSALMPMVVAEYLLDALDPQASPDRGMIAISGNAAGIAVLRRAARRRAAGYDPSIRLASGSTSIKDLFSGRIEPACAVEAGA